MTDRNFKWLEEDIDVSLVLKVIYKKNDIEETYGIFNVKDVLDVVGDELEIETANIDDLTKLLTLGIVRFYNVSDNCDILDIPFRNLYLLYQNGYVLGNEEEIKLLSFKDLDVFSILDGTIKNDMYVVSAKISEPSNDLTNVMKVAFEFGSYGMQEKMDALNDITVINYRRLMELSKDKNRY